MHLLGRLFLKDHIFTVVITHFPDYSSNAAFLIKHCILKLTTTLSGSDQGSFVQVLGKVQEHKNSEGLTMNK